MVGGTDFMEKMREVEDTYRSRSRQLEARGVGVPARTMQVIDNLCRLASSVV